MAVALVVADVGAPLRIPLVPVVGLVDVGIPERLIVLPVFVEGDEDASEASLRWLVPELDFAGWVSVEVDVGDDLELGFDDSRV